MCDAGGGPNLRHSLFLFLFKTRVFPPGLNSILPAYSNADRKKERNSAERSRGNGKKEKTLKLPEMKCLHTKSSSLRVIEVLFGTELYRRRKQNPPFIISLDPYSLGCFFAAVSSSVLRSVPESGGCQNSSILRCWRLQDWKLNEIMWKIGLVERGEGVGRYHSLRSRVWSLLPLSGKYCCRKQQEVSNQESG